MMNKLLVTRVGSVFATVLFVTPVMAGVYSDDLAKCFVNSTTTGAGRELFSDPSMSTAMGNLNSYINKEKMESLLGSASPTK